MIKIRKERLLLLVLMVVVATLILTAFAVFLLCKATGVSVVNTGKYERQAEIAGRYERLAELQDKINQEALNKGSREHQLLGIYKGLVSSLDDPYSEYLDPEEAERFLGTVNANFSGIGVSITERDGRFYLKKVISGSPADQAGLRKNDEVLEVDGASYDNLLDLSEALRGEPGSKTDVTIKRDGGVDRKTVIRGKVTEKSVESEMLDDGIACIRINTFSEDSADVFRAELNALLRKDPTGLIIDLRNNGGGYADQGIKIADQLLPECTITYIQNKDGEKTYYNSDEQAAGLPLVILVNEGTASTSELVAASVQANKAGTLVGTVTYGKGMIQDTFRFDDGSLLKLTTSEFFAPDGSKVDGSGVTPDVEQSDDPEDSDPVLEAGIRALENAGGTGR